MSCQSNLLFNKRLRCSARVKMADKQFVIDIGPDFRQQALKFGISDMTGVILTHAHYDHIGGIDDVRPIFFNRDSKPIPCLCTRETFDDVRRRFDYMMHPESEVTDTRYFTFQLVENLGEQLFEGVRIIVCDYAQFGMRVLGLRFGDLAYLTDIAQFGPEIFSYLEGVKTVIISALRFSYTPTAVKTPAHFNIEDAIAFFQKVGGTQCFITHIAHEIEHEATNKLLPENVRLAHDGLEIEFTYLGL